MEARSASGRWTLPGWLAGVLPLAVLAVAIAIFTALGGPGIDRPGVPIEKAVVERTVLRPGEIELRLRNDGPDPIAIRQAIVNDAFVPFTQSKHSIPRLASAKVVVTYPWIEGEAYEVKLLTTIGTSIVSPIDAATESPEADLSFFGLMALIGLYVGVIPIAIGMLWLPWLREVGRRWVQFAMAVTVGLLVFLAVDAGLEGLNFASQGAEALGGAALVFLGAIVAFLTLAGIEAFFRARADRARAAGAGGFQLALLIAVGIGLHNLGEGLAIGAAYAIGSLALGATLVVGFALHNTTEGLAIVAPVAEEPARLRRLVLLGFVAGAPAIVGAWIGASAFDPSLAAFMLGLGAGAITQVITQIAPSIRDRSGQLFNPLAVGGLLTGLVVMYITSLLITV